MCKRNNINKYQEAVEPLHDLDYVKKSASYKKYSYLIIGFSLLLIIVSAVVSASVYCIPRWLDSFLNVIMALSASALAGAFITTVLDLPEVVDGFRQVILEAFSSDSYIKLLPKTKLESIRKQAIQRLHKDNSSIPDEFLNLDSQLDELVDKPYYDFFNENVTTGNLMKYKACVEEIRKYKSNKDDCPSNLDDVNGDFYIRETVLEYEIINPLDKVDVVADISIKKVIDLHEGNIKDMFVMTQCEITLDDSDPCHFMPVIKYHSKDNMMVSSPQTMTYNTSLSLGSPINGDEISVENLDKLQSSSSLVFEENTKSTYSSLLVKFKNKIKVRMAYKQIIPSSDNHYTRRMRYAAREYLIHFSCEDDYKVHGQVLGTLIDQRDISISQNERNPKELLIHCRGWLLPGNGTFIVLDDK